MKKIGKLTINPEKVIKNEELVNLKGGYDGGCLVAYCNDESNTFLGDICVPDCDDFIDYCQDHWSTATQGTCAWEN